MSDRRRKEERERERERKREKEEQKPRLSTFFVPGTGIDREVISADICRYLGNDALVKPGTYQNPTTGEPRQGYFVTAFRALTTEQLSDIKADSLRWRQERERNPAVNRSTGGGYSGSLTQRGQFDDYAPQQQPGQLRGDPLQPSYPPPGYGQPGGMIPPSRNLYPTQANFSAMDTSPNYSYDTRDSRDLRGDTRAPGMVGERREVQFAREPPYGGQSSSAQRNPGQAEPRYPLAPEYYSVPGQVGGRGMAPPVQGYPVSSEYPGSQYPEQHYPGVSGRGGPTGGMAPYDGSPYPITGAPQPRDYPRNPGAPPAQPFEGMNANDNDEDDDDDRMEDAPVGYQPQTRSPPRRETSPATKTSHRDRERRRH